MDDVRAIHKTAQWTPEVEGKEVGDGSAVTKKSTKHNPEDAECPSKRGKGHVHIALCFTPRAGTGLRAADDVLLVGAVDAESHGDGGNNPSEGDHVLREIGGLCVMFASFIGVEVG